MDNPDTFAKMFPLLSQMTAIYNSQGLAAAILWAKSLSPVEQELLRLEQDNVITWAVENNPKLVAGVLREMLGL